MLKYSSILPKVNFESLTIENKDSNNVNLNFYFSWESNLTDKWFSDEDYLNTLTTTVQVTTELSSSDSFESLTQGYSKGFNETYLNFSSNKNQFLLEGKVLEKIVNGERKYIFPFSFSVTTDIVEFNNLQISFFSVIDLVTFLRSKEIPEDVITNVYNEFRNSLEYDDEKIIKLITNGNIQQSVGVINDFRIIESLDRYDAIVMEQGRLENYLNSVNSIEHKQILFSLNEAIDDLKIFSDLLINQTLDDSLIIFLYFNYDNAIQKLSPLLNLTGPTNIDINVYKHNLTNDNKIIENSKVLVQNTILNNSFLDVNELNTKFLFFNDTESKLNMNQKFVYELELTLQDLTINEIYNKTNKTGLYFDLQQILNILKSYLVDASTPITTFKQVTTGGNPHILPPISKTTRGFTRSPPNKIGYYNTTLNKLDISFIDYAKTTYDIDNLLISLNDILKKLIKVIYPLETDEIGRIVTYITTLLFPSIATPNTISNAINFIEKLSLKVENIFSKIKSNISVYNKIFIDQPILLNNTNNTYFSFAPTNQRSYSKQQLIELIKNDKFLSSELLYFTPANSKVLNVSYRSDSYDNLIYSDDVFIESNIFPVNKLLSYYRILDLESKSITDAEDFIDNLRSTNVPKDLAFSNNCTSTSNKLLIRSETESNRNTLPTRDEFTLNKYQLNITQPQEPITNNSRNVLNVKQNFNNLFEQQNNVSISTPSIFVENPNAIKAENELLFYLFVFAPNSANTNAYRYVPIAKIQYLDVNIGGSDVSKFVWKDLTNEVLNNNLSMAQKFCKFELVSTFRYGTSNFESIPLLSNNINNLLIKNKYFYLEQNTQPASPVSSRLPQTNTFEMSDSPFKFSPTSSPRLQTESSLGLQTQSSLVEKISEQPFKFRNENLNEREQQIKIESQPFVQTQKISEKPRTVIITNNKIRVKQ